MAVRFDGTDGNFNVSVAGHFNASDAGQYAPTIGNATGLTIVFTIQPDSLPTDNTFSSGTGGRPLCQLRNPSTSSQVFQISYRGDVGGVLQFLVFDSGLVNREVHTLVPSLTAGVPNRCVFRWRASPEAMSISVNGITLTAAALGGSPITAINGNLIGNNAPLELGACSGDDARPVPGVYQQWAIWSSYASDADVATYGATGNPANMSIAATARNWVTLAQASITPIDPPGTYGTPQGTPSPQIGHIRDVNSGLDYAATTTTYNYGGGNFQQPFNGVFGGAVVADLTTQSAQIPHVIEDGPALPVEWFELEELNGNCGQRSGVKRLIPSVYANLNAALTAAQYGDDIVIDHTYTATTAIDVALPTKTFGPTTPRMPPTQKRLITMGRAITSAH